MDDNIFVLNHVKHLEYLDHICNSDISLNIIEMCPNIKAYKKILWNYVTVMPDHSVWKKNFSPRRNNFNVMEVSVMICVSAMH